SSSMFKDFPSSRILKQIARLNKIAGTSETAYKIDLSKFAKVELYLIQKNIHGPSVGLRKFWRHNLPTLKFHNSELPFVMTRISAETPEEVAKCPAKIVVHGSNSEKFEINCANKHSSAILDELVKITGAVNVPEAEIPTLKAPQ
ncbi:uncharacterized protein CANTADRAFT_31941, partial [Suhomyces tanzawaensis NRRL Y-17324]